MDILLIIGAVLSIVSTALLIWKTVETLRNFDPTIGGNLTLSFSLLPF